MGWVFGESEFDVDRGFKCNDIYLIMLRAELEFEIKRAEPDINTV